MVPKNIVKKVKQIERNNETSYNLIVFEVDGIYNSKPIHLSDNPLSVASADHILEILPFELHLVGEASGKYNASKCKGNLNDDSNVFDSRLEYCFSKELEVYEKCGFICEISRQIPFSFSKIGVARTYKPDFIFECCKDFTIFSLKKTVEFKAGKKYYIDVKSPITKKDSIFGMKKQLMKAVWGIDITVVVRSYSKPKAKRSLAWKQTSATSKSPSIKVKPSASSVKKNLKQKK